MKAIKNDSDEQKKSAGFSGKNRGVTPSGAAPGVTHPSDATARSAPPRSENPGYIYKQQTSVQLRNGRLSENSSHSRTPKP